MTREPDYTSIRISKKNFEILRRKGNTPETFDNIISKMLEEDKVRMDYHELIRINNEKGK